MYAYLVCEKVFIIIYNNLLRVLQELHPKHRSYRNTIYSRSTSNYILNLDPTGTQPTPGTPGTTS